ncbi:MAG TPA: hypothetical protein DCL35_02955 [Candidatus Omnitrophica bacterium]|nr:hypothetical protein [Candidatus Omnitrophota bacterium]
MYLCKVIFVFFVVVGLHYSGVSAFSYQQEDGYDGPEAMKYFKSDRPRRHLTARLYRAGALYVGVVYVMDEAAGLKVYLPLDREPRLVIFKAANEALVQAGFRSEDDTGQDTVTIWFKG